MALSIRNIITQVNATLEGVFKGSKIYGMAVLVEREGRAQPTVNEQPVSYDDSYALQIYHRVQGATITYPKTGYGNSRDSVNTFQVFAVIFNNEKITKIKTDEIAMIIQSVLSNINIPGVTVLPTSFVLNSQQVFAQEYKGTPYSLDEYRALMQINYTVEIIFKGICFNLCPEDFTGCQAEA